MSTNADVERFENEGGSPRELDYENSPELRSAAEWAESKANGGPCVHGLTGAEMIRGRLRTRDCKACQRMED